KISGDLVARLEIQLHGVPVARSELKEAAIVGDRLVVVVSKPVRRRPLVGQSRGVALTVGRPDRTGEASVAALDRDLMPQWRARASEKGAEVRVRRAVGSFSEATQARPIEERRVLIERDALVDHVRTGRVDAHRQEQSGLEQLAQERGGEVGQGSVASGE